jgi:DNA-binding SARP family transcriptional activator
VPAGLQDGGGRPAKLGEIEAGQHRAPFIVSRQPNGNPEVSAIGMRTESMRPAWGEERQRWWGRAGAGPARLALLNTFELRCDGKRVTLPMPSQRLLAFLALQDRAVLRAHVAGTLWLESTEDHAFGSLRSALWRLRQPGYELIETTSRQLRLATQVAVDVRESVAWARRVLSDSTEFEDTDLGERSLCGELLPDWYDDWVLLERERFRELRVRALEFLSVKLTAAGRFGEAVEAGLAAVQSDPLRESAHRSLIALHLAEGNQAEAVRRYRLYRRLLHEQLGLEPSSHMEELVGSLMKR